MLNCGIIKINRGMDVKNLTPSYKVTIHAPNFFNLTSAEMGVGNATACQPPLVFTW